MVDVEQVIPILSHQEQQQLHAPGQDHVQQQQQRQQLQQANAVALNSFNHQHFHQGQEQPLQPHQSSGHQDVSFHHNHNHHHDQSTHDRQLEDITRAFLLQEMTSDPTGVRQGSQAMLLQQHTPILPSETEDELNIYDYIHAKQEDDDEQEDHDASASTLSTTSTSQDLSHLSPALSVSSIVSASSPSATAACTPPPSSVSQYDHATANTMTKEDTSFNTSIIKTEDDMSMSNNVLLGPVNYMDTSMEIYEPTQDEPVPNQVLYRILLDELQSTQREKYFSATTGPSTGMDSVTFLFSGQPAQTQTPTKADMQMMGETAASPSVFSTKPEPLLAVKSESGQEIGTTDPGPAVPSVAVFATKSAPYSSAMEDVFMEIAEPEDSPMSPGRSFSSSSSSGSVTPELTSPLLPPTDVSALLSAMPPLPKAEKAKPTRKTKVTPPKLSKPSHRSPKANRSSSISPITELCFLSAIEQHNARYKAAESTGDSVSCSTEKKKGAQPGPAKKRKLSRQASSVSPSLSPIRTALPSPPASVRTTPPMQPSAMDITSALEKIDLPPPSIQVSRPVTTISTTTTNEPVSPVSPSSPTKASRLSGSESATEDVIMESTIDLTDTLQFKRNNANAKNKRPWTTEEEKLLLKLVDDQTPIKDIAETLDRSVHSVRSRRQVLTDPGFVKGNGHAQPRRSKPDPSSKLPTYSQMAFLSLARLPELQGTLNDVASMVEKLFSRYLNRIPRTGHKNLQIWRAQISDALAHEKGHPRPRFESFGIKRGRQWVYRLTAFGKGVMNAMGGVDEICEDLLKNNDVMAGGVDGEGTAAGGAGAGLGQGNGYGYSYCPDAITTKSSSKDSSSDAASSSSFDLLSPKKEVTEETSAEALAASAAIANAMAAMAAGMAAMTAVEDERSAAAALKSGLSGSNHAKDKSSSSSPSQQNQAETRAAQSSGTRAGRRIRA